MTRKKNKVVYTPYGGNPNIHIDYELPFGRDVITPGMPIKFKNDRDVYQFQRVCTHRITESQWIDCLSQTRKSFHSLPLEKLKGVVKAKRSRAKK